MRILLAATTALLLSACAGAGDLEQELPKLVDPDAPMYDGDFATGEASIIVDDVEWIDTTSLASDAPERLMSASVGLLELPAVSSRCTAFLVAPDVIMTNNHCIGSAADARGATVTFDYEGSTSLYRATRWDCDELIGTHEHLDYSLVRCAARSGVLPGERHGVVTLSADVPATDANLYLVHQNCDYYADPYCDYTKKVSPGVMGGRSGDVLYHDADALGGSSGSPLFDARTHAVVGLHHAGWGSDEYGRGWRNEAVLIRSILDDMGARFPQVLSGPTEAPALPEEIGETAQYNVDFASPHEYGDNVDLSETFRIAGATRVRVHFARIDTEARYDFVTVSAGDADERFDGNLGAVTTRWFDGEEVSVAFASDRSVTAWGFEVAYVEAELPPEEVSVAPVEPVGVAPGEVAVDFASTHDYGNNQRLERTFEVPGAHRVRLRFARIETEDNYDFVTVSGGGAEQSFDGNLGAVTSEWFDGERLTVVFSSDYSVTAWGFEVEAIEFE